MIGHEPFAGQQIAQTAIAEAVAFRCQLMQPHAQRRIIRPGRPIPMLAGGSGSPGPRLTLAQLISGGFEVISAFAGQKEIGDAAAGAPESIDCPGTDASQMCFEFGEGQFDRIEIGRVGRGDGPDLFAFVARQVVEDEAVTELECRRELGYRSAPGRDR